MGCESFTTSNGIPYAGGPKSGCIRVEPACIAFFQIAFFFAMGSFETSMFQTLSDGKTRHALPGTGALIGMDAAEAGRNAAAASIRAATAAADRILPLMPRIIGIPTVGS